MGLLAARTDIPSEILAKAQTLDLYYIPARYPNGLASGKPADYFNRDKAKEALDAAGGIQRFCESLLYLTAMRYWSACAPPFHRHFQERLPIGVDVITITEGERPSMRSLLEKAVTLAGRQR